MNLRKIAFLLLVLPALFSSSCTIEKRHYRSGWYFDKQAHHSQSAPVVSGEQTGEPAPSVQPEAETILPGQPKTIAPSTSSEKTIPARKSVLPQAKQETREQPARPPHDRPMTYAEARRRMAEQGCVPNKFANTIYWLAVGSAIACYFTIGVPLLLVALILSFFAEDRIYEDGSCVEENLAIVKAAQRIIFISFIVIGVLLVLMLLFIFGLLSLYSVF